jgi:N-acetylmuramoyl-L-alanine amidase
MEGGIFMPFLFLSPSTQDFNPYVTTGNEQYWMNQLADRMEPYLFASGLNVTRNDPNGSAAQSIRASNAGTYDFHLALHSNASPEALAGRQRGVDIYYFPASEEGLRMANILVDNLKPIYPLPERVRALPTVLIGEVRRTKAPSVLAELGYHDNVEDADWLTGNLEEIAAALSEGVTEYFGLPFLTPSEPRTGIVTLSSGTLNLRSLPTTDAAVLAQLPNGATVTILGQFDEWYTVEYDGLHGFASSRYITVL